MVGFFYFSYAKPFILTMKTNINLAKAGFSLAKKTPSIDDDALRRTVGVLGIILPILLPMWTCLTSDSSQLLPSLSHYFFTTAGSFFTITLSALALFLIIYNGYDNRDHWVSSFAGVCALLVVICPTGPLDELQDGKFSAITMVTGYESNPLRESIHFLAAVLFISALAYMSLFLFTLKDKNIPAHEVTKEKKQRNRIYRFCGIGMAATLLIGGGFYILRSTLNLTEQIDNSNLIYWIEAICILLFGISWFVKGKTIFLDKVENGLEPLKEP